MHMARTTISNRLLIVDDQAIVREGLKHILDAVTDLWVLDEASNGFEALERLRTADCQLVIVELSIPGMGGLELIRRVRLQYEALPVLVLSSHAEDQYAMRALKAGANGYLTKDCAPAELVRAMRKVMGGGVYVSERLAAQVVVQLHSGGTHPPSHADLSDRELDVLCRLVSGQRAGDIAQALHLSIKTVSTHKSRIQDKLQLHSTAALIRYGLEHQLCSREDAPSRPVLAASSAATYGVAA
jgi:two-component system invasion response regulator UvrY